MTGKKIINPEDVENFVKSKREELDKMIPDFVNDRKFTDIVLNFYERGIRDGVQMIIDRMTDILAARNATHASVQMSEASASDKLNDAFSEKNKRGSAMKESDFKELWKDNKKYEHVPLPKSTLKILKRQYNGYVLHAFIYHDTKNWADGKDHKSMVIDFDKIIRANIVYIYIYREDRECVAEWTIASTIGMTLQEKLHLITPNTQKNKKIIDIKI